MNLQELINRVININIKPTDEWQVISNEPTGKNQIITGYAVPLTVLVAIAYLLGNVIFPKLGIFSITYSVATAIAQLIVSFFGMFISALIVKAIAPSFGSKNDDSAFKWVIYSFTPFWVISIVVGLIPILAFFGLVGLYSIYLMWTGATPVMGTPEDKKAGFVVVSILITLAVYFILSMILMAVVTSFFWSTVTAGAVNILH